MNLTKLFETQKVLRDRINYNEPDRFNKLILALLVELGECANEWRGFKFWSKDQEPRTRGVRNKFKDNVFIQSIYNPLLEEYVDGLHFVLELGLEINYTRNPVCVEEKENALEQFNEVYYQVSSFKKFYENYGIGCGLHDCYDDLLWQYTSLGEMLGFTWEQIEQAYYEKNKTNHKRQEEGY